jgi:hypothetical protein
MALHEGDLKAGVTGLVIGTALLFAVTFTIVKLTNASHARHETPAHAPAATAPAGTAPAGTSPATPAPAGAQAPATPAPATPAPAGSH